MPYRATARRSPRSRSLIWLIPLAWALASPPASAISPDSAQDTSYTINQVVNAIARDGNTLYLGGSFTQIGTRTGGWAALSPTTAEIVKRMPPISTSDLGPAQVVDAVPDGDGGWYVAGQFDRIGGLQRRGFAHILSSGTVDQDWTANIDPDPGDFGRRIYIGPDGTLYVTGRFDRIDGEVRTEIGALDPSTGRPTAWAPNANRGVDALAFAPDGTIYAGGTFTSIGAHSAPRTYLAALDPKTGEVLSWNPGVTPRSGNNLIPSGVEALAVAGSGTVYVGGYFSAIGTNNAPRNNIASLDPSTGAATSWNPNANDAVYQLRFAADGSIYAVGGFTTIGSNVAARPYVAALDPTTGNATSWNPAPDEPIIRLAAADDGTVYVGGMFTMIGSNHASRDGLAAIDPHTGEATSWAPSATTAGGIWLGSDGNVYALLDGTDPQRRGGLAAIDLTTGHLKSWAPDAGGAVYALAIGPDHTVYVAGEFTTIGTNHVSRPHLAAIDPGTGEATAWRPNPNSAPYSLAVRSDGTVYVGGEFSTIGANSQSRAGLAAIDSAGNATSWNPNPSYSLAIGPVIHVVALSPDQNTVYVGGSFNTIGTIPQTRNGIAALDPITGAVTGWDPNARESDGRSGAVVTIAFNAAASHSVYLGGVFSTIGANNASRHDLAELAPSPNVANATGWNPDPIDPGGEGSTVEALALGPDGTVYVGGDLETIGAHGVPRAHVAAVDPVSGEATGFDPEFNDLVTALATGPDGHVYAGGFFFGSGYDTGFGFASFGAMTAPLNTTAPHVSGTPAVGSPLTCPSGIWSGGQPQTTAYQWKRDGTSIGGATTDSYTPVSNDGGHGLSCVVRASNEAGSASVETSWVSVPVPDTGGSGGGGGGSSGGGGGSGGGSSQSGGGSGWGPSGGGGGSSGGQQTSGSGVPPGGGPGLVVEPALLIEGRRVLAVGHGALRLRVRCRGSATCRGILRVMVAARSRSATRRLLTVARARFALPGGRVSTVRMTVTAAGGRHVGHRPLRAVLRVTWTTGKTVDLATVRLVSARRRL